MIQLIPARPRFQTPEHQLLLAALKAHPQAHTAKILPHETEPTIELTTDDQNILLPHAFTHHNLPYKIKWAFAPQPKPMILPNPPIEPLAETTKCYNAPIPLGVQIQPFGRNWVGTAGGPVRWLDQSGTPHWGFITNAHVTSVPTTNAQRQIHQPTTQKPAIGHTQSVAYPSPSQVNTLDVALVDTRIDGKHKTDWQILEIGRPAQTWSNASPKMTVHKTGRTTGHTHGTVRAVGVAARINYGSFVATLIDLDEIIGESQNFSAPGDSGSLILNEKTNQPLSLLFAGSGQITLAIPIRNISQNVKISFKP